MLNQTPVLDNQVLMLQTCQEIVRDKMQMLTSALALWGRVSRHKPNDIGGYMPLAHELTVLAIISRRMAAGNLDMQAWTKAVENADFAWWEWFDNYRPKTLIVSPVDMNYSPHYDEREEIRARLRKLAYSLPAPERKARPEPEHELEGVVTR